QASQCSRQEAPAALRWRRERITREAGCQPHLDVTALRIARVAKVGWHDADDGVRVFIHANSAPDDMRIRSELSPPETIADDDAVQEARHPLGLRVHPPEGRRRAEELEIVRARTNQADAHHAVVA